MNEDAIAAHLARAHDLLASAADVFADGVTPTLIECHVALDSYCRACDGLQAAIDLTGDTPSEIALRRDLKATLDANLVRIERLVIRCRALEQAEMLIAASARLH